MIDNSETFGNWNDRKDSERLHIDISNLGKNETEISDNQIQPIMFSFMNEATNFILNFLIQLIYEWKWQSNIWFSLDIDENSDSHGASSEPPNFEMSI